MAKKWIVLKNTQLTSCQSYVYCKDEYTACAVKARLEKEPNCLDRYSWVEGAPHKEKAHWCVVQDEKWVVAHSREVREGQWYLGIFATLAYTNEVCGAINDDESNVECYGTGNGPLRDNGFVVVNAHEHQNPVDIWLYRNQLSDGDCFEYLDSPGKPHVVRFKLTHDDDLPAAWAVSTENTARRGGMWNAKVRRIPHWKKREPVILPCIDPLDDLLRRKVGGLTGAQCLARLEIAMRTESVVRQRDGEGETTGFISTYADGLTAEQFAHGQACWTAKLSLAKQQTIEHERMKVTCDPVGEMPNMVEVP